MACRIPQGKLVALERLSFNSVNYSKLEISNVKYQSLVCTIKGINEMHVGPCGYGCSENKQHYCCSKIHSVSTLYDFVRDII